MRPVQPAGSQVISTPPGSVTKLPAACTSHIAIWSPTTAPRLVKSIASIRKSRMMRSRPAPSHDLTAISRRRRSWRTSIITATFAHPASRIRPDATASILTKSCTCARVRAGSAARAVGTKRIPPPSGPSPANAVLKATSAPATLAPSFSRAVMEIHGLGEYAIPSIETVASLKKFMGAATSGAANTCMKKSTGAARSSPRNPFGNTPTTTESRPPVLMVRPITAESPPRRVRQNASVTMTTGSAPGRVSATAKPRPNAGRSPTTSKNRSVTKDTVAN